jgi:hypothetical protein
VELLLIIGTILVVGIAIVVGQRATDRRDR